IQDANPDRVTLINIHQGGYAVPSGNEPDFRTPYGNAIVGQSYSGTGFGYPSGTVNRHVFPGRSMASGGGTAMSRSYWTISANETMAIGSAVNVAVEASIDVNTNVLTVHVEGYYTSNSPEGTNLLNVALLQNNTKGPQTGGGQGNNYNHMHRLVEMITGQWGEVINTTTAGTFVDRTYTYT
ncbi:MAG: Omp28-related outer membrane protein, partial [Aequorivita sp.]|nr:Omp28-related outer membrane protein [Aequorivita sp.]